MGLLADVNGQRTKGKPASGLFRDFLQKERSKCRLCPFLPLPGEVENARKAGIFLMSGSSAAW